MENKQYDCDNEKIDHPGVLPVIALVLGLISLLISGLAVLSIGINIFLFAVLLMAVGFITGLCALSQAKKYKNKKGLIIASIAVILPVIVYFLSIFIAESTGASLVSM